MTWLSPWTIALAAGLTLPPLLALYFLKLKRRVIPVPSTLLWKRAIHDLQVNAPFQKLRKNLLLFLQLLILLLAAGALGKPMVQALRSREKTMILLIDQSASMSIVEEGGQSRLELAKDQAKRLIDDMSDGARAMVIAFCDRATTVCPFESDRGKIKRLIDSVEPTQSLTLLGEAMSLAEAYSQNLIIGGEQPGTDLAPTSAAPPASAIIFSDGGVADAPELRLERLGAEAMEMVTVGSRADNVGIVAMSARRNYERPELLQVFATVSNFGHEPVRVDAAVYINGDHRDVQELALEAAPRPTPIDVTTSAPSVNESPVPPKPPDRTANSAALAFDPIMFEGAGIIEVRLQSDDALATDNRAWAVVPPSRPVKVLLVTRGNFFLERVMTSLPLSLATLKPDEYESADDGDLVEGERSVYDVVIFDDHSTAKLPVGSYFFWGGVPLIEGVSLGDPVATEAIVNWEEAHPILRHVALDSIFVDSWRQLTLPGEAVPLIEGESSPVLAHLSREGRQYLICAFSLITMDPVSGDPMLNTDWVQQLDFVPFVYNALQFLSANVVTGALRHLQPGEPVEIPVPERVSSIRIHRPDGEEDAIPCAGMTTAHYAKTRTVGVYRAEPALEGQDLFAVNLFSAVESDVAPKKRMTIGGSAVESTSTTEKVNQPLWTWALLAALAVLMVEWIIYNKRVWV